MASTLFFAALAACLASAQGAAWLTGGSTAAQAAITAVFNQGKAASVPGLAGNTISYAGVGSGTGVDQVVANTLVASFSDVAQLPSKAIKLDGFPVALGSIAVFINSATPGLTATTVFTTLALCKIYDDRIKVPFAWSTLDGKPLGATNAGKVRVAVRTDSSGSTSVLAGYLTRSCGAGYVFITPTNPRAISVAGKCEGTSGELACVASAANVVGYAGCGSVAAKVVEVAIKNKAAATVKCQPAAGYTGVTVTPPTSADVCSADWTKVTVTDTQAAAYPLAYLLFSYNKPTTTLPAAQLTITEAFYNYILSAPSTLGANFYRPLPANILKLAKCCAAGLPSSTPSCRSP